MLLIFENDLDNKIMEVTKMAKRKNCCANGICPCCDCCICICTKKL